MTAVSALAVVLSIASPAPAHAEPAYAEYVALGDSYASGPGIPEQKVPECERSDHNYAHLLAEALQPASFTDVTCGRATTEHLTSSQKAGVPPQFEALGPDTDLVTLTIGGNDAGFMTSIGTCALLAFGEWWSNPCQKHFTAGGTDQVEARIGAAAAKLDTAIEGIRARSPRARIVLTGYLRLTPDSGGCWPFLPFAPGDIPWVTAKQKSLNDMIEERAEDAGVMVVDPYEASTGRDACKSANVRWNEPTLGGTAPAHPNAAGMAAMAELIEAELNG
ncbi:SGNH/GDSL hydrolase family protein [Spirillospora sp. NPDC052242]